MHLGANVQDFRTVKHKVQKFLSSYGVSVPCVRKGSTDRSGFLWAGLAKGSRQPAATPASASVNLRRPIPSFTVFYRSCTVLMTSCGCCILTTKRFLRP